jgi:hypothetical protein
VSCQAKKQNEAKDGERAVSEQQTREDRYTAGAKINPEYLLRPILNWGTRGKLTGLRSSHPRGSSSIRSETRLLARDPFASGGRFSR